MAEKQRGRISKALWGAWHSRAAGWTAAVILAIAVIVGGISVGMSIFAPANPDTNSTPVPVVTESSAPATSAPTSTAQAGGCDVPAGDTSLRPAIPKDLRWIASQGLTWPVSATYGPTKEKDGFGVCFARSPLGAALAASSMLYSQYNGHSTKEMTQFYVVDSPGKQIALGNAGAGSSASDFAKMGANIAGFMVDEFTPDRVGVTLVFSYPQSDTGYIGLPYTLVWVDGDWRIKLLDNGGTGQAVKPVQGQFVQWRPANG